MACMRAWRRVRTTAPARVSRGAVVVEGKAGQIVLPHAVETTISAMRKREREKPNLWAIPAEKLSRSIRFSNNTHAETTRWTVTRITGPPGSLCGYDFRSNAEGYFRPSSLLSDATPTAHERPTNETSTSISTDPNCLARYSITYLIDFNIVNIAPLSREPTRTQRHLTDLVEPPF